ncbi:MAG: HlyD family efflux transporter periplasmic adaptor subunit [Alphaproteobacteria bacterium]|jgi:multidrug resistance efflux pump|nr:HlyD family efflux transporter periplasmic adaptor subunit [Alphaproteobacteria bacterium]
MGLSLGHIARITFAVILLLIIAFVYLPHLFYTYSITAIVSAPVISITSPIEGVLKEGPPVMGTEVKAGETVGVVENLRFDRWRLDDMSTELKGVQERIVYMQQEANKIEETKSRLLSSFNNYSQSVEERLKIEIKRAKEALRERADTISESKAEYLRKSKLYAKGVVAENQADSAFFNAERAAKSGEQTKLEIERLEAQLKSLQNGVFINLDGRTEVSYQKQKIDELTVLLHSIASKTNEARIREQALKESVKLEEARYKRMSEAKVVAPFNGVSWRVFSSKGSHVDTTRPLLELVDCSKVFVDTSVHERYFGKLKAGDSASIKLVGDNRVLKGKVQFIRGGALSESSTAFLAGATQVLRPHEIQVMIKIDEKDVEKGKGQFCYMGRTGEVSFDKLKLF